MVDSNNRRGYVWRRPGEVWRPECLALRGSCKLSAMFWGCITYQGVGTFTEVEGNINSRKYINILDTYLWSVIARHFPTDEYSMVPKVLQHVKNPYIINKKLFFFNCG